ncbi:MAG: hypothetical protein ACKN89_02695 [Cyanobium sp.]|jgi:hypothetical protein
MQDLDVVKPARLRIAAFLDPAFSRPLQPAPNKMTAAFDPESLSIKQENAFESRQGLSTSGARATFHASKSRQLTVKLSFVGIDFGRYGLGNALQSQREDVADQLSLFERLCHRINSSSHEPAYLRLNWFNGGLRSTFEARLKSHDVSYELFDQKGKPLLANLTATFVEAVHSKKKRARARLSSPDLSHRHLVLAGESLPMLCQRYYGSTDAYLQIASFNQLDDLRDLRPGQELLFPPLAAQEEVL